MKLEPAAFGRLKDALLGADLPGFARYMSDLQFRRNPRADAPRALAEELGLVRPGSRELTEIGWFVADACREYVFWLERGRRLPFEEEAPAVVAEALAGRSVLEIGSGSGMNLLAIAGRSAEVVGLEPMTIYRQVGGIMAEAEGIGPLEVVPGTAESLPFESARFDTVLCVTAHQYFDIAPAFREAARVLKPSGELVVIGGTLGPYAVHSGLDVLRKRLSGARAYAVTITNTLSYMALRRRLLVRQSKWSTAFPVYPSRQAICRYLRDAGLDVRRPPERVGTETCFRAVKPA
jgi:SAM-dependent methyltransferase